MPRRHIGLMRDVGVTVDVVRAVDHVVPPGVQPDMTAHGAERDDWPALQQRVAGADSDFTERNLTFMTWNLLHLARMLKDAGGLPAHGNVRTAWDTGTRYGLHIPEYRMATAQYVARTGPGCAPPPGSDDLADTWAPYLTMSEALRMAAGLFRSDMPTSCCA